MTLEKLLEECKHSTSLAIASSEANKFATSLASANSDDEAS